MPSIMCLTQPRICSHPKELSSLSCGLQVSSWKNAARYACTALDRDDETQADLFPSVLRQGLDLNPGSECSITWVLTHCVNCRSRSKDRVKLSHVHKLRRSHTVGVMGTLMTEELILPYYPGRLCFLVDLPASSELLMARETIPCSSLLPCIVS